MPAGAEALAELEHRIGAARPPAVGDELQHGRRPRPRRRGRGPRRTARAAASPRRRASGTPRRACARSPPARPPRPRRRARARSRRPAARPSRPPRGRPSRRRAPPRARPRCRWRPPAPTAKAWSSDCGTPSVRVEASTKQSIAASNAATSDRKPVKPEASATPASRASASTQLRRMPSPTRSSVARDAWRAPPRTPPRGGRGPWSRGTWRRADDRRRQAEVAAVAGRARAEREGPRFTPAGIATTRRGGAPAPTTRRRIASPLVITRSASQR